MSRFIRPAQIVSPSMSRPLAMDPLAKMRADIAKSVVVGGPSGGSSTVPLPPADFVVTNDAEWTAAIAAVADGEIIEVSGSNFLSRAKIDRSFATGITIRGADASAELPFGLWFSGTVSKVNFNGPLIISRDIAAASGWWSPLAYTTEGLLFYSSTPVISNIVFDGVTFDGGLDPLLSGGLNTSNTSINLSEWTGGAIRNCTIRRCWTGLYMTGSQNVVVENNTITAPVADAFVLTNGVQDCANNIIRNNHMVGRASGIRYHTDWLQFQPNNSLTTSIRDIEFYGNTMSIGTGPWMAQPDPLAASTYTTKNANFTATLGESFDELQCNPGGGTITATLPAASAGRYQYFIRQVGTGTINVALNGADTWNGGAAPTLTAAGQYKTFISDGVSNWTEQRTGADYSPYNVIITANTTIPTIWDGQIVTIDASGGNVTVTLPAGATTTDGFVVCRFDNSANTVTLAKTGGDTITTHAGVVSSVSIAPGYSAEVRGTAGAWAVTEDPVTSQGFFGNNITGGGSYTNIRVHGNIAFFAGGDAFRLEASVPGCRVFNNTFLQWLADDMNGDGVVGAYEANNGPTAKIDVRGSTAYSFRNFTIGDAVASDNAVNLDDTQLLRTDSVGAESVLDDYFNGTTRAAYRPNTRAEVIAAALAKSGGALDGTFIGACGTSTSNGYYNFASGVVNTAALPAPTISGSDPIDGGTTSQDSNIVLTMSQFCTAGTGNITIRNVTDSTNHEVFNVATGTGSSGGTITFSGRTITLNPFSAMTSGKSFSLRVDSTAIVGHYGKTHAAISDDTTLNWTTTGAPATFPIVVVNGDRLNRASSLSGMSGTKQLITLAWHGYRTGGATLGNIVQLDGVRDFAVTQNSSGEIRVAAGTSSFRIPAGGATVDNETHLLTIDLSAASLAAGVKFYRNGTDIDPSTFTSVVWNTGTNLDFGSTIANILFNNAGATTDWQGRIGMLYLDMPSSLVDIDDSAIRAKFGPSQINSDGSGPSGTSPLIYMSGNAAYWNTPTNSGTGGTFTVTGTFADA